MQNDDEKYKWFHDFGVLLYCAGVQIRIDWRYLNNT